VHGCGVIHRDIKPANIVLSRRDDHKLKLYLLDFGIARSEQLTGDEPGKPAVAGTPSYMAPEVLTGNAADVRSDLYAVGVVLYHCLTGSLPYRGACTMDIVNAVLYSVPRPISELAPETPPALLEIAERALAKLPALRFESAAAMQRALTLAM
jgi:eukaryotic-like serine/threonine-protein kinase